MITWMQRHKKWLVITIWISTIAFVGAGFVGWGSYDYGKSSGSIATVGDKKITMSDLNNEYQTLYNKYQNAFGELFNKEMAEQFKLKEAAYNSVVQKFLLLNYANELGFYATNREIAKYLITIPSFQKDGKFDKNIYLKVLKQNRTTPTDFEDQIKKDIVINKLVSLFNLKTTQTELKNINILTTIQDKVSINIVDLKDLKIKILDSDLKKYWEQNKEKYKTKKSLKISLSSQKIGTNKKSSKKDALKKYLKLKKNELKFDKTLNITEDSTLFTPENIAKINKASNGTILKPLKNNDEFIIVKVISTLLPTTLTFQNAKTEMKNDYIAFKTNQLLTTKIKNLTSKFTGKDIGFITINSTKNINGLSQEEVTQLTKHISTSSTVINSIVLSETKAVVYKITDSKLSNQQNPENNNLETTLSNIKNNEIISKLIEQLKLKYEVISNIKVQ